MLDLLFQSIFYIKIIFGIVLLGILVFEIILLNRLRAMNTILRQSTGKLLEVITITLFVATLAILLTTLAIL